LKTSQSDITNQGYLFSVVVIFLGNVGVLLVGIPLLAERVPVLTALRWWVDCTGVAAHQIGSYVSCIINWLRAFLS
jgi:hypothetical protein